MVGLISIGGHHYWDLKLPLIRRYGGLRTISTFLELRRGANLDNFGHLSAS